MRKICYVTGTRADFGLMQSTLQAVSASSSLELDVVVTGMHLSERFGLTVREIEAAGLNVAARIEVDTNTSSGAAMACNLAATIEGCVDVFERLKPDVLLLLGDRGEMLAGALAAIHLNIPVVHIHGGERSGTVDELVRHAISKLSHFHFVATDDARDRLIRMGEYGRNVYVTGAPGLDGIHNLASVERDELLREIGFSSQKPVALLVYHPVLQEADVAAEGATLILDVLDRQGMQVIAIKPNSDAGSDSIRRVLEDRANNLNINVVTHFPREKFVSWMRSADLIIGNSSSGIIEAASFGTPVINIGSRQNFRERNSNIVDVPVDELRIESAIMDMLNHGRFQSKNIYGDGNSSSRIVDLLINLSFDSDVLMKSNAY